MSALVIALRATAARLASGSRYQWGHLGMCNCGHLVETVCKVPPQRIHVMALEREGDWEQLANAYCPTSGYAIDDVIAQLLELGMTTEDIGHLEKLDDPMVLASLPGGDPSRSPGSSMIRWLRRNERDDVVVYLETWASLLEARAPARAA